MGQSDTQAMRAPRPRLDFKSLPRLFKGAGPGTYWCTEYVRNRNRLPLGITSPRPDRVISMNDIISHIAEYSSNSPLSSVSTSYAVALAYARTGPGGQASPANPGFVFEIDPFRAQSGIRWFDPIAAISSKNVVHHHQGDQKLLLVLLASNGRLRPVPIAGGKRAIPVFSQELRAVVHAARDAELLVEKIPPACILKAHSVGW